MYNIILLVIMSLCDNLSVCVFSLGKKLTRQEDQKLFITLFGLTMLQEMFCRKIKPLLVDVYLHIHMCILIKIAIKRSHNYEYTYIVSLLSISMRKMSNMC